MYDGGPVCRDGWQVTFQLRRSLLRYAVGIAARRCGLAQCDAWYDGIRPVLSCYTGYLGPGLIKWVGVRQRRNLQVDDVLQFRPGTGTVALDGEREIELIMTSVVEVRLCADGPFVVDVPAALEEAAHAGHFYR